MWVLTSPFGVQIVGAKTQLTVEGSHLYRLRLNLQFDQNHVWWDGSHSARTELNSVQSTEHSLPYDRYSAEIWARLSSPLDNAVANLSNPTEC